jgi:Baseplate J-like protein
MPISLPNLDDRTFADLVAEAHTLIPVHAPEWTNHNESDPGITLVELFAYLTEMQIYRLNRVTDANLCAFLSLIDGVERKPSTQSPGTITRVKEKTEVALRDEVRNVVLKLRQQDRAVTCEDFERLALAADQRVSRSYCVPRSNLTSKTPYEIAEAHVSVVIVPIEVLFDRVFWYEGDAFNDVTNTSAGGDTTIPLWSPKAKTGPLLYLGSSSIFDSVSFALAQTAVGYTLTFEYFNGKGWAQLSNLKHQLTDNTSNWSASGLITFTPPPDWTQSSVNDSSAYWLRISTSTAPTQRAIANRISPDLSRDLIEQVTQYLEPRRLLTTPMHVVGARAVPIGVNVNLGLKADAVADTVEKDVLKTLNKFFNPQKWPFGRNVYVSEIYRVLDQVAGVDFVTSVDGKEIVTAGDGKDRKVIPGTELVAIKLNPDELASFSQENSEIVPVPQPVSKLES